MRFDGFGGPVTAFEFMAGVYFCHVVAGPDNRPAFQP